MGKKDPGTENRRHPGGRQQRGERQTQAVVVFQNPAGSSRQAGRQRGKPTQAGRRGGAGTQAGPTPR